jgi:glycosyltransferase involved in cell wall biosynthesis
MSVSLYALLPLPLNGMGVGYTCGSLAKGMADRDFSVTIVTPRSRWPLPSVEVIEVLPNWARYLPYRWVREKTPRRIEQAFLSCIDRLHSQRSAAYLWPNATFETLRELKRRDVTIFREQFNCHTGTAKKILDRAYERLGATPRHGITAESVDREIQIAEAVDHIFCPSHLVEASLLENGVPAQKVLKASYGWDPARLAGNHKCFPSNDGITAVFVGAICVRKGAHLLLDYWARSKVKGRLVLAGEMEPIIKEKCADLLARDDVTVLDYFRDVGSLYRSADIFIFPSLEEGSPLVIYEACGSGLPIITTEMAAGWVVRHGREGFVLDPYDASGWITALRALADDVKLRRNMSSAAATRARQFMWATVARQRQQQVMECIDVDR